MKEIIVSNIEGPMRLDRYLKTIDPSLSQGIIEKALRQGDIRIDGAKIKANQRVERGDIISIKNYFKINEQDRPEQHFSEGIIALANKMLGPYKLYENDQILAINKPSGLATQGGSKINLSIDHALQYLNTQGYDLRLVHRLDRETSGVLLLAKTRKTATIIGEALENRTISKKYLAITNGFLRHPGQVTSEESNADQGARANTALSSQANEILKRSNADQGSSANAISEANDSLLMDTRLRGNDKEGHISSYLAKVHDRIYEVKANHEDAKLAETSYKVLSSKDNIHLIEFMPSTGRMHQIRCHAAYSLKTQIVGDDKYGSTIKNAHLFLHASNITIPAKIFRKEITISAELPNHFKKFIEASLIQGQSISAKLYP